MNILLTTVSDFFQLHHAFNLRRLDALAQQYNFIVFAQRSTDNVSASDYSDHVFLTEQLYPTTVASMTPDQKQTLQRDIIDVIEKHKATKVTALIDIFTPFELVPSTIEKVVFVRNSWEKIHQLNPSEYSYKWAEYEKKMYQTCDTFLTDSITSKNTIKSIYGVDVKDIVLPVIDPTEFSMQIPSAFTTDVYNVGRIDHQKGLNTLKTPTHKMHLHVFGGSTVDTKHLPSFPITHHGAQPYAIYAPIIKHIQCGLFPAVWESNGYAVQECLAMGKVPIVQFDSQGNTEYITHGVNGFLVDFNKDDWSAVIHDHQHALFGMAVNAKHTITHAMYTDGLNKLMEHVVAP